MDKTTGIVFRSEEEATDVLENLKKMFEEESPLSIYRVNEYLEKGHNDENYKFLGFESVEGFKVEKVDEYYDGEPAWVVVTPGLKVIR